MINYSAYSAMLTNQVDICFPFEKSFFQNICISSINSIAEIGCGNGYFLKTLHSHFPSITYFGCDISETLIEEAKKTNSEVSFGTGSLECLNRPYDLVILRLIVHQLPNSFDFLQKLTKRLSDQSQIVIIEPFDKLFQIQPQLSKFDEHLVKHRKFLSPGTANRDVQSFIQKNMKEIGFQLEKEIYYFVPSSLPGYKVKYSDYMKNTCNILGCSNNVIREIDEWYKNPNSYVQIGLIMFHFKKQENINALE